MNISSQSQRSGLVSVHSDFSTVQTDLASFLSSQKQETCCCLSGRERGRKKKHLTREIVLWCQQGASFNFFSSFFKLILQGYAAWVRSDLLPEIPLISRHKRAYQPRRVFWYLIATPWCCCAPPPSLQNCLATLQTGSTGMEEWTGDCLHLRKI